jgi:transaldolase/glucose-6-phosphate isomerase
MSNPLVELEKVGQSIWYDQMERRLVSSGKLQQMIDEDDLRGLTSNPTIFEKAIASSDDYDEQLEILARNGKDATTIYDEITIEDIGNAADVFRPVYDKTQGGDGFCSLEVAPNFATDTAGTQAEARRLFDRLGRPNVMIKIPATPEGIPAIEESIAAGININITLIFSNDVYAKVIEAYLRGLERRAEKGEPIGDIGSVASFFVSRIDTLADKQIQEKIDATPDQGKKLELAFLLGKIAIANARMAYQLFKKEFFSPRFQKLRDQGARVQRPLWASTGTKNPKYSDVLYLESLIGADTVNTVPPATYEAFKDHGRVTLTLEQGVEEAAETLRKFHELGFSLEAITTKLTADGVKSFDDSFVSLMGTIESRRDAVVRRLGERVTFHTGASDLVLAQAMQRADKDKFVGRIWSKDTTLWKKDDEHKKIISNALGWLTVVELMHGRAAELKAFAESVKGDFGHVVVLGMGGSSLCSEVVKRVFGAKSGYPVLEVLDSTVPEAIRQLEAKIDVARTLFIVASKSGTTTEPLMFHRYFYDRVKQALGESAGRNFVAVTDPDTQLGRDAARDDFRKIFINPADIGGRYSALSYFGMVPAAISGVDVEALLDRALHTAHISQTPSVQENPAAHLGTVLGTLAEQGRDKLTLITPAPLDTLGLWIEQLVAESTGKEGKGILPVAGEPQLDIDAYGKDRLFVAVRLRDSLEDVTSRLNELTRAGHPVIDIVLEERLDLGEIFFLWEFATAVAGAILGIDAFDQPNVQESKDNTRQLLDEFKSSGKLPEQDVVGMPGAVTVYSSRGSRGPSGSGSAEETVGMLLAMVSPGDYVALTEYFAQTPERDALLEEIRSTIASSLHVATTTGYGPRFLHSTGQLHKGGGDNGVFLQLTADSPEDVAIPGEPFTFGVLAKAQALGDFQSLASRGRRALRLHFGNDVEGGLKWLRAVVQNAVTKQAVA